MTPHNIQLERMAMALFYEAVMFQHRSAPPAQRKTLAWPDWTKAGATIRNSYREAALDLLKEQREFFGEVDHHL